MVKRISVLVAILFLLSCGLALRNQINVDPHKIKKNYNKMFSAAIYEGAQMHYTVEYQDKENGLLTLVRTEHKYTYRITVKFNKDNFKVKGEVENEIVNPFIDSEAKRVEDAILKVLK